MQLIGLEAEHLARHMEGADLPPSVGQELGHADHAGDDLVDIARSLALGVNLGIAGKAHGKTDLARGFGGLGLAVRGNGEGAMQVGFGNGARSASRILPRRGSV